MRRITLLFLTASAFVAHTFAQSAPFVVTTLAPIPGRLLESSETPGAGPTLLQREIVPNGVVLTVRRLTASGATAWARGFNPDPSTLTEVREHTLRVGEDGSVAVAVRFAGSALVFVASYGPGGRLQWSRSFSGVRDVSDLALGPLGDTLIGLDYARLPGGTTAGSIVKLVGSDGSIRWRKTSVASFGLRLAAAGPVWLVAEPGVPSRLTGFDAEGRVRWQNVSSDFVQQVGRVGNGFFAIQSSIGPLAFVTFFGPDGRGTRVLMLCGCEDVQVSQFGTSEFADSQVSAYRTDGFLAFRRVQRIFGAIPTVGEALIDPAEAVWTMATGTTAQTRLTQLIRFDRNGRRLAEATSTQIPEFTGVPRLHLGASSDAFIVGSLGDRAQVVRIRAVLRPVVVAPSASTVRGGIPLRIRVIADQPAGVGGAKMVLRSNSSAVPAPANVLYAPGRGEAEVIVPTRRVAQPTTVRLTIGSGAAQRTVSVRVVP